MKNDSEQSVHGGDSRRAWDKIADAVTRGREVRPSLATLAAGIGAAAACAVALSGPLQPGASPQAPSHMGGNVLAATTAEMRTTEHAKLLGRAPATTPAQVIIELKLRDPQGAKDLATAVSTRGNRQFHHYITAQEFGSRFGPTTATVDSVVNYLRSHDLKAQPLNVARTLVVAQGSVAQMERAFGVKVYQYGNSRGMIISADRTPTLPGQLQSNVIQIGGLGHSATATPSHSFGAPGAGFRNAGPLSSYWGQKMATTLPKWRHQVLPYAVRGYTPQQIQSFYNINPLLAQGITGAGQTIGIIDAMADPTMPSAAETYSQRHGLGAYKAGQLRQIASKSLLKNPGDAYCSASDWAGEEALDVEAAHATAPGANELYVGAKGCDDVSLMFAMYNILDHHRANIITDSWGSSGEADGGWDTVFEQAATEGISVNFSSGDSGDELQNLGVAAVDSPVNSPWDIAVGGTSALIGADGTRIGELGWGTTRAILGKNGHWSKPGYMYGGGGGVSNVYTQPAYQAGVVPASMAYFSDTQTEMRTLPDVSMMADPGTGMLVGEIQQFPGNSVHYGEYRIGGTSLSSPLFAGVEALINQATGTEQGFMDPSLYQLANTAAYNDIVSPPQRLAYARVDYKNFLNKKKGLLITARGMNDTGDNITTQPGYDLVTGLGSPNAANLVAGFEQLAASGGSGGSGLSH